MKTRVEKDMNRYKRKMKMTHGKKLRRGKGEKRTRSSHGGVGGGGVQGRLGTSTWTLRRTLLHTRKKPKMGCTIAVQRWGGNAFAWGGRRGGGPGVIRPEAQTNNWVPPDWQEGHMGHGPRGNRTSNSNRDSRDEGRGKTNRRQKECGKALGGSSRRSVTSASQALVKS